MMNEYGKSDNPIVPKKLPNKASLEAAEVMEERGLAKGNRSEQNTLRTQGRAGVQSALGRIRQALASSPEAGARCVSSERRDLRGGCGATRIPTATHDAVKEGEFKLQVHHE